MDRSPDEPLAELSAIEAAQERLRAEQDAWLQEQAEWEEVRAQVETGLSELEERLLQQAKRLRCPRGSEEFEAALNEQLRLAADRQAAAEKRLEESERRREDLVEQLGEARLGHPSGVTDAELDRLREALDLAMAERDELLSRIADSEQEAANSGSALAEAQAEAATLREERDRIAGERDAASADLATLTAASEELAELRKQHEQLQSELVAERDRTSAIQSEADNTKHELAVLQESLSAAEALAPQLEEAQAAAAEERQRADGLALRVAELETAESELTDLKKQQRNSLLNQRDRVQALESELTAWDADRAEYDAQIEALQNDNDALAAQLEAAGASGEELSRLEASDRERTAALEAAEARLVEVQRELDQRAAASATDAAELERLRKERSDLFRELDHNKARAEDVTAAEEQARALLQEKEQIAAELTAAREHLVSLEQQATDHENAELDSLRADRDSLAEQLELAAAQLAAGAERDASLADLQGKFDLALADLHANREQVAALEAELASRPDTEPSDDGLLQQLTEERDALQRQLEEATPVVEPSAEIEELRQRFEMAVEDVRRLKTENQELSEQLASQPAAAAAPGNDWEAQKQRLLAALADEGEADEPERQSERASIAGTIQITDDLIAEKDREIEQLRAQTAHAQAEEGSAESLDADEAVQRERERIAKLEAELSDKLRTAELELSVERAKISRAQSELEEQQLELETLRAAQGLAKDAADGTAPRRRWLDKLGLGGDEQ